MLPLAPPPPPTAGSSAANAPTTGASSSSLSATARTRPAGHTLLEMAVALSILAIVVGAGMPRIASIRDRMSVRGAREAVIGHFARARAMAVGRGGATLRLREDSLLILTPAAGSPGPPPDTVDLLDAHGVRLEIRGASREAEFAFDALGIGRMTSRTLVLRRGAEESGIIVSAYGRARRR